MIEYLATLGQEFLQNFLEFLVFNMNSDSGEYQTRLALMYVENIRGLVKSNAMGTDDYFEV